MRKLSSVALCILLLAAMAVTAFAAGSVSFSITASPEALSSGDTVTLSASVSSSADATAYGLKLTYDANAFEVVSGTCEVPDALVCSFNNGFAFMFQEAKAYSGAVGTATLKVKDTAPDGTYTIIGVSSVKNGGTTVDSASCSVVVTVSSETANEESTSGGVTVDIGEVIESLTLPSVSVPVEDKPMESEPQTDVPAESVPTTGLGTAPTIDVEPAPENDSEGFPAWIFLVVAGVIAVAGVVALVILKKKK